MRAIVQTTIGGLQFERFQAVPRSVEGDVPRGRPAAYFGPSMMVRSAMKAVLRRLLRDSELIRVKNLELRIRLVLGSHYEPEVHVALALISLGATVIDVGANIGQYTIPFSRRVGLDGAVVSLEPSSEVRRILENNVRSYSLSNVTVLPYAASEGDGVARLFTPRRQGRRSFQESSMAPISRDDRVVDIETIALDSLELARCDFVKIDTEGAELSVLKGARRLIRSFAPILLLEVDRNYCSRFGYEPAAIVQLLHDAGYVLGRFDHGTFRQLPPDVVGDGGNIFAMPERSRSTDISQR
jgi:FkbM family methyltransferase